MKIIEDIKKVPHAFFLNKITFNEEDLNFKAPQDLIKVWQIIGVGDLFETEELYGPCDSNIFYDINCINEDIHDKPADLMVFHKGTGYSAFHTKELNYYHSNDIHFKTSVKFTSFNNWYEKVIRSEYFQRYNSE